ncbi:Mur ligase family protein, partial [Gammaproteobacteria bacterium]|nr:Mur ligase family protein [Gammaproteobacteria bacterium]
MTSLIFGYGVTGQSFDRYLTKNGVKFDIYDVKHVDHPNAFSKLPSKEKLQSYEMVYISPGINILELYPNKEFEKVNFKTDLDIFFEEDSSIKIGITGTNGKSTCCMHLSQLLDNAEILGNFGRPLLDSINSKKKYSIIELSSFQLEKMKDNLLDFGVLLNIAPDHIDHHGSFNNYINAKNRILEASQSTTENGPFEIFEIITGNKYQGGLEPQDLINLPHRLEKIILNNRAIIINDSKSTNTDSLKYALCNVSDDSCMHLILMGDPSKERYDSLLLSKP